MTRITLLAALVLGLVGFAGGYRTGNAHGQEHIQAQWDAANAIASRQQAAQEQEYRAREQALQRNTQQISDDLHAQLDQTRTDYILAVDAARAVNRLRPQFRGCPTELPSATGTANTPSGDDDAGTGGLSAEDESVAIRIASDADRVAHKLAACQLFVLRVINGSGRDNE